MSSELTELRIVIADYALEHSVDQIPDLYFEKTIQTWHEMNSKGHDWDSSNAAAALLYATVTDGIVHRSQLTPRGYLALNWAEQHLKKI